MSTRRRADEFAGLVDGVRAPDDVSAGAREFFAIVARLRDVEAASMRPEFAADLRERLMTAAPTALAELPPPIRAREASGKETRLVDDSWRTRGLQIATTTLLVCATAGGVAAASQSALPGDPLYQVKRGLEWVQVVTAGSDQDRGDVLLNQASERLAEAERLAISRPDDPRTSSLISSTLDDFEQQATDGSNALVDDYRADGDPASIVEVREFADESSTQLDDLGRLVPPDVQRDVVDAAGVLTNIDGRARDTCETCSALEPLQLSSGLSQLSATTQGVLDVLPGALGSATGGDGGQQPPVQLPTLPAPTGSPGDNDPTHQGGHNPNGGHQTTDGTGGQGHHPQLPLPTGGGVTTPPSIPLPSVPGVPLPTSVPLPSLPLPSLPLPTILPLP
jgi:Domain of unknown function (DUF5667)